MSCGRHCSVTRINGIDQDRIVEPPQQQSREQVVPLWVLPDGHYAKPVWYITRPRLVVGLLVVFGAYMVRLD
jgi:hypothetical protein